MPVCILRMPGEACGGIQCSWSAHCGTPLFFSSRLRGLCVPGAPGPTAGQGSPTLGPKGGGGRVRLPPTHLKPRGMRSKALLDYPRGSPVALHKVPHWVGVSQRMEGHGAC